MFNKLWSSPVEQYQMIALCAISLGLLLALRARYALVVQSVRPSFILVRHCPSCDHISKTKQDRLIVTMEHCWLFSRYASDWVTLIFA